MYFDYLNTKSFMYVFSIPNLKQRTEYLLLLKCFAQFGKKVFKQIAIMLKVTTFLCQYELAMQSCTNRQSNLVWISSFFIIPRCNLEWAGQIKSVCIKKCLDLLPHTIYTRNNIGQKCEGNCGLWVLNEMI